MPTSSRHLSFYAFYSPGSWGEETVHETEHAEGLGSKQHVHIHPEELRRPTFYGLHIHLQLLFPAMQSSRLLQNFHHRHSQEVQDLPDERLPPSGTDLSRHENVWAHSPQVPEDGHRRPPGPAPICISGKQISRRWGRFFRSAPHHEALGAARNICQDPVHWQHSMFIGNMFIGSMFTRILFIGSNAQHSTLSSPTSCSIHFPCWMYILLSVTGFSTFFFIGINLSKSTTLSPNLSSWILMPHSVVC